MGTFTNPANYNLAASNVIAHTQLIIKDAPNLKISNKKKKIIQHSKQASNRQYTVNK
jgi:hypothetical protein